MPFNCDAACVNNMTVLGAIAQCIAALGTLGVIIIAIWGDAIRAKVFSPNMSIELRDTKGSLSLRGDSTRTIYYHLCVTNLQRLNPPRGVRIEVVSIEKKRPDGSFHPEHLVAPLQLTWAHPQFHELAPTVYSTDLCDLGYLDEGKRFQLSTYIVPNNFRGHVSPHESLMVAIKARGENFESSAPFVFEIAWDGVFNTDMEEMLKHLVIKPVVTAPPSRYAA